MSPGRLLPAAGASLVTLVWAALVTPGSAHRDAPPASFSVVSAHWHLAHGAVPADELLDNVTARDECECLARCFRRVDCLSFSWVDGHCILYSVRGNVGSLRPGPVRFRTGLGEYRERGSLRPGPVRYRTGLGEITLDQVNCAQFVGHPDLVIGAETPLIPFEQGKIEYQYPSLFRSPSRYQCGPGQLLVAVSTSIGQYQYPSLSPQPEYQCGPGQLLVAVSTSIGQYLPRPGIVCAPVEEPHTIGPVGCETVTITEPEKYQSPVSDTARWVSEPEKYLPEPRQYSEPEKYQSSVSDTASWPFQCPQLPQPLGITAVSIDTLQKQWTSITCCLIV
ncbi:hypothetical protein FJT64_022071 [Amphibalanus amphitrite]|uniref:Apple domain-containing protein n=1 Tax=Amphibalanus amphitrite TaxID=1232801 RepID=A0A6A4WG15_AMPAM|nr:hypothetical protein FJT64_022071 [Amphibalanus amphitrite]